MDVIKALIRGSARGKGPRVSSSCWVMDSSRVCTVWTE